MNLTSTHRFEFILIAALSAASLLQADGFRNAPEGARAIGQFGARRAFADDANAAVHNPANLVDLEQPMIQINNTVGYARAEFNGSEKTENPWFSLPGLSAAAPLANGRLALGFALTVPFGRSSQWKNTDTFGSTPGVPYDGTLMVMDASPTLALKINDALSVAAGPNVYYSEVEQKTYLGPFLGTSKLTGDGDALGWNAAATWKITGRQRLTLTYRSAFTVDYDGENQLSGTGQTGPVTTSIDFPDVAALAYGFEFTDTLRAEIDVERVGFGTYDQLSIKDPLLESYVGPIPATPQNWKDTWTYAIGGEWDFAANWTARTGFKYLKSPVPDATYSALGNDEDQGVISLGLGYETDHHAIDVGYAYGIFDGRKISEPTNPYQGEYDYNVHLIAFSYGYKF